MKHMWGWATVPIIGIGVAAGLSSPAQTAETAKPQTVSLAEGRRLVRMMNDIYINGVLTTHSMYVHDAGVPSAVTWAKQVLRKVEAKGWPKAHIFDATDRPLNPENNPRDAFEKEAVNVFKTGKAELEKTTGSTLRFAVPVRVPDESCITCHVRAKVGDLLGGVSYSVPMSKK
jgi:hypothetical protein